MGACHHNYERATHFPRVSGNGVNRADQSGQQLQKETDLGLNLSSVTYYVSDFG